jgi:hypothetical protein
MKAIDGVEWVFLSLAAQRVALVAAVIAFAML